MNDKISVIMACYNCGKTVRKSIDSILAQTYTDWVMICCDDGSTDDTWQILNEYKEKFPDKFVLIQNDGNKKLPYSLNHCLEYVETDFVARMDADDWCLPKRFEIEVNFLKEHPEYDLVSTGVTVFDGEKKIASIIKFPEPTKETMLTQNAFSHATILTYKRVYDALGGYSLEPYAVRCEDFELWCRFLNAGFKGYNIPDELYVMVENKDAAKRRTFKSRLHSAKAQRLGYQSMGFKGGKLIKPYFGVLKSLVPYPIYEKIHKWSMNHTNRN